MGANNCVGCVQDFLEVVIDVLDPTSDNFLSFDVLLAGALELIRCVLGGDSVPTVPAEVQSRIQGS